MYKYFNHLWRIIATGLCFAIFGFGGILLTLLVFPLQKSFIKDKSKQKKLARKTVHYTFKFFIALMAFSQIFNFDLAKAKKLSKLQGQLVLANHPSLIDIVVLISIIPNADCVVKAHLFKNPFIRGVVKNTGYISNADPEGLLLDCRASLASGNNLIIFPEGTRSTPKQEIKFQRGASNIALRCLSNKATDLSEKNRITTVLIRVKPTTLTKSEPWYKVPDFKATFSAELIKNALIVPPYEQNNTAKQVRIYNRALEDFFITALQSS